MFVNLLSVPVLLEHPPKYPHPPHPDDLKRQPRVGRTAPLSVPGVATLALGLVAEGYASAGVDDGLLADYVAVLDLLLDSLTGVRDGHVGNLVGVDPNLALTAL